MIKKYKTTLKIGSDTDVAYVSLDKHPLENKHGCVKHTLDLRTIYKYNGPNLYFDLDDDENIIGIEILYD